MRYMVARRNTKDSTEFEAPKLRQRLDPETRASQILDFAARLILDEGFSELSMERLSRYAGVSKALIYNYFENRTELLRALLEREISVLRVKQRAEAKQAIDFRDLVYRTTRTYVEHIKERGALIQRLWAESAVARTMAEEDHQSREQAMRYLARRVSKEYSLPVDVAMSAVDMQMAMTEAAAQHLSRSHGDVSFATNICVTLLLGGLESLSKAHAAARLQAATAPVLFGEAVESAKQTKNRKAISARMAAVKE
jgi:TetR/AcrR family transcriptional regulator, fatty acid biosynthesis regulator